VHRVRAQDGKGALHWAAATRRPDAARQLVACGADPRNADKV
jgi:hypothetical protein